MVSLWFYAEQVLITFLHIKHTSHEYTLDPELMVHITLKMAIMGSVNNNYHISTCQTLNVLITSALHNPSDYITSFITISRTKQILPTIFLVWIISALKLLKLESSKIPCSRVYINGSPQDCGIPTLETQQPCRKPSLFSSGSPTGLRWTCKYWISPSTMHMVCTLLCFVEVRYK